MTPEDRSSLPPRPTALSPVNLPASSPKRRFIKLGRKPSDGSVQSGSSSSSTKSADSVGVAIRQPSRSRIRRHTNRLSGVFHRGSTYMSNPMALTGDALPSLFGHARRDGVTTGDATMTDDPSELSNQITAPGILKIFGSELCEGANYKSVLATTHSSAKELVKEALERYGLNKEEAEAYVLCDAIGYVGDRQWRTECFRVVGDNEKPLLLQSLWKPREGLARRFEIQRRSSVEEQRSRDKDTVTAGINAQARKLQKSRSRVTSALIEKSVYRGENLWRSRSEMDLLSAQSTEMHQDTAQSLSPSLQQNHHQNPKQNHEKTGKKSLNPKHNLKQKGVQNQEQNHKAFPREVAGSEADTEPLCPARQGEEREGEEREGEEREREEREREEREREETESSDDNTTQYSIHPPQDCPYLLLLQGYSYTQDFVIYLLNRSSAVIGRCIEDEVRLKVDFLLSAPDILPRHCCLRRHRNGSSTLLHPFRGAKVMRNGETLRKEAELSPGDVIGLGTHYLFLFKDPTASVVTHKGPNTHGVPEPTPTTAPWLLTHATTPTTPPGEPNLCQTCSSASPDPHRPREVPGPRRTTPYLTDHEGHDLTLHYDVEYEDCVVKEIVAMERSGKDRPALTVSFLLCVCVQYSATHLHTSDLRRLLLLIASQVQDAMWKHTKELAAIQPEVLCSEGLASEELLQPPRVGELIAGLRPLVVWMSNALELLHFIQHQLPHLLAWRTRQEQGEEEEEEGEDEREEKNMALLEMRLSCVRSVSEETMTVLEEVIMLTFQQCVYYLTKALYPILPGLLDCNPFMGSSEQQVPEQSGPFLGSAGLMVPGETEQVLGVLTEMEHLLLDCQVHPEISSQLLAYLFYFINASLLNTLMERGSEEGFYQWSRGVCIRANLDLLLDWAHGSGSGLGELALEYTHTLSSAVNLLAMPRENLLQASWVSMRSEFSALSPAQLHHLLSSYSPAKPSSPMAWAPSVEEEPATPSPPSTWAPSVEEEPATPSPPSTWAPSVEEEPATPSPPSTWAPSVEEEPAAHNTADVLESFDTHPPLVLPSGGFLLELRRAVADSALAGQLERLKELITSLSVSQPPGATGVRMPQDSVIPMEAKLTKMAALPKASLESPPVKMVLPLAPQQGSSHPSHPSHPHPRGYSELSSPLLTQKLRSLELQTRETEPGGQRRSALDPSCLLTPPNTPHNLELVDLETDHQQEGMRGHTQTDQTNLTRVNQHGKADMFVAECLSSNCINKRSLAEKEEDKEEEEKVEKEEDEEVFSLELQRGDRGLGLALIDARDFPLRMSGIFIRAVVPDSPAGRCKRLGPGDRILAVNGVSLVGLDYQSGKELIQCSGDRPRLLVARADWTVKVIETNC